MEELNNLLKEKLELSIGLKKYTKEIISVSSKTNYEKLSSMINERQNYVEKIDKIDSCLKEYNNKNKINETIEIKTLKKQLKETFIEISELDNIIRKNINDELRSVKKNLNQPDNYSKSVNIKA